MDLDLLEKIKKLDKGNVYESVVALPDQCRHAYEEALKVEVPDNYKGITKLVMCGM
ncbi:MAG: hypothetical protein GYA36_17615, partial [Veillonellaceae bacterium]|nr:hypothetical protein [Veillonellaceae bacterium]